MTMKTSFLPLETDRLLHGDVDIVGEVLELLRAPLDVVEQHPRIAKIGKSSERAERHIEGAMPRAHGSEPGGERVEAGGFRVSQELHREVPVVRPDPAPGWIRDGK